MNANLDEFVELLTHGSDAQKVSTLRAMRDLLSNGEPSLFFDLAVEQVRSRNSDVRWQAIIIIGEYIPSGERNDEVWRLIAKYCSLDDDMKDALATVLLEHLLEYDFDRTINRVEAGVAEGSRDLVELLERCSRFGESDDQWRRVERLIEKRKR